MSDPSISGQQSRVFFGAARLPPPTEDVAPPSITEVDARISPVANDSLQDTSKLQSAGDPAPGLGWTNVAKPKAKARAPKQPGLGTRRGVQIGRTQLGIVPGRQRMRGTDGLNPEVYVPKHQVNAGRSGFKIAQRAISSQELVAKGKAALAKRKPVRSDTEIQRGHKQRVGNLERQLKTIGAQRGQTSIVMGTLGNSANPVTRMHEESMIPSSEFPTEFRPTPENKEQAEAVLQQTFQKASAKTSPAGRKEINQIFGNFVRGQKLGQQNRVFGHLPPSASPQEIKAAFEDKKGQLLSQNMPGVSRHADKIIIENLNNIDWSTIQTVADAEQALSDAYTLSERSYGVDDDFSRQMMHKEQVRINAARSNFLTKTVVTGHIHHLTEGLDENSTNEEFTAHFHSKLEDLQAIVDRNATQLKRRKNPSAADKMELQALENLQAELALLTPDAVQPTPQFSKQAVQAHLVEIGKDNAAEQLNAEDGEYVTLAQLEKAGIENPQQVIEEAGIETQYSLLESLEIAKGNPRLEKLILGCVDIAGRPGFAFKAQGGREGAENFNELRFQEHLSINGGNQFIAPKTVVQMDGVTIVTSKGDRYENPEGIVSDFLEGAQAMSKPQISSYGVKHQEIRAKEFRGEEISLAEQQALEEAEAAMEQADSVESVMAHAMSDLEFWAGDNHAGQYMRQEGHVYNIDYARGNAPGEAELKKVEGGQVETFATLKAVMFDHPHARKKPIPDQLVQQLLNRDLDAEEQQLREAGMIGDPEFFELASKRMAEQEQDYKAINFETKDKNVRWTGPEPSVTKLKSMARKYGIPPEEIRMDAQGIEKIQFASRIRKRIAAERVELKGILFKQDPPKGHALRMQRVRGMQEYVRNCQDSGETPTFTGMRNHVLRDTFAPFLKVMERMDYSPGMNLGMHHASTWNKPPAPRSLEAVIRQAEAENLASPEELSEMQAALDKIKADHSCSSDDMRTAYYSF